MAETKLLAYPTLLVVSVIYNCKTNSYSNTTGITESNLTSARSVTVLMKVECCACEKKINSIIQCLYLYLSTISINREKCRCLDCFHGRKNSPNSR